MAAAAAVPIATTPTRRPYTTIASVHGLATGYSTGAPGCIETLAERNARWVDAVKSLIEPNERGDVIDIATLQDPTLSFMKYAFNGKLPKLYDGEDYKAVTAAFKSTAGALSKVFYHVCSTHTDGDQVAVIFRRDKYAAPPSDGKTNIIRSGVPSAFAEEGVRRCYAAVDVVSLVGEPVATVVAARIDSDYASPTRTQQIEEALGAAESIRSKGTVRVLAGDFGNGMGGITYMPTHAYPEFAGAIPLYQAIANLTVSDYDRIVGGEMLISPRPANRIQVSADGRTFASLGRFYSISTFKLAAAKAAVTVDLKSPPAETADVKVAAPMPVGARLCPTDHELGRGFHDLMAKSIFPCVLVHAGSLDPAHIGVTEMGGTMQRIRKMVADGMLPNLKAASDEFAQRGGTLVVGITTDTARELDRANLKCKHVA